MRERLSTFIEQVPNCPSVRVQNRVRVLAQSGRRGACSAASSLADQAMAALHP